MGLHIKFNSGTMSAASLYHTFKRYRTLQTHRISALPIVILMPHSACNCRCVMCDIWKDNKNLKQLTENDILSLLTSLRKLGTQEVLMSGGEALLNQNFFKLCEILKSRGIRISLLSTGLSLKQHASDLIRFVDNIIVSLDGDELTHDRIRNIPGAYSRLREGVQYIKSLEPAYPVSARTVIQKLNFSIWPAIVESALEIGLDRISFLPADVSSTAFNREQAWSLPKQQEILLEEGELPELALVIETILSDYADYFARGFIAESPEKIQKVYAYYAAFHGLNSFPYKKCNAPWVSAVIEADGSVRPCFFHETMGNIREQSFEQIINSDKSIRFRKNLDLTTNPVCATCVCYLNLHPTTNPGSVK
jgi:MoaA/NifB/PqqE/SkfB family radical SAM enzyme